MPFSVQARHSSWCSTAVKRWNEKIYSFIVWNINKVHNMRPDCIRDGMILLVSLFDWCIPAATFWELVVNAQSKLDPTTVLTPYVEKIVSAENHA